MIALKLKTKSVLQEGDVGPTEIKSPYGKGRYMRVCAIYYSGNDVNRHLTLFDGDGDRFIFSIPGQEQRISKSVIVYPTTPTPISLPISYIDEDLDADNDIIIWGELYPKEPTGKIKWP